MTRIEYDGIVFNDVEDLVKYKVLMAKHMAKPDLRPTAQTLLDQTPKAKARRKRRAISSYHRWTSLDLAKMSKIIRQNNIQGVITSKGIRIALGKFEGRSRASIHNIARRLSKQMGLI